MATLKGQNLRILAIPKDAPAPLQVIGMATSCTITLTGNTEDANTKDDVSMASKPEITSKSWSVQAESLNVVDVGTLLRSIKDMQVYKLVWDETATSDNQTPLGATLARSGEAYLSDLTLNFNDRENSAKSVQFTGVGALEKLQEASSTTILPAGVYTKGQYVRLFLSDNNSGTPNRVIAAAKSLSMHVSLSMEDSTTKDTVGDWQRQEPTGLSYDISSSALVRSGETITSGIQAQDLGRIEDIYEASAPVKWKIANVSGDNNRTAGAVIASGSVVITQLTIQAANRQNATYDAQLTGYGVYTVGS